MTEQSRQENVLLTSGGRSKRQVAAHSENLWMIHIHHTQSPVGRRRQLSVSLSRDINSIFGLSRLCDPVLCIWHHFSRCQISQGEVPLRLNNHVTKTGREQGPQLKFCPGHMYSPCHSSYYLIVMNIVTMCPVHRSRSNLLQGQY